MKADCLKHKIKCTYTTDDLRIILHGYSSFTIPRENFKGLGLDKPDPWSIILFDLDPYVTKPQIFEALKKAGVELDNLDCVKIYTIRDASTGHCRAGAAVSVDPSEPAWKLLCLETAAEIQYRHGEEYQKIGFRLDAPHTEQTEVNAYSEKDMLSLDRYQLYLAQRVLGISLQQQHTRTLQNYNDQGIKIISARNSPFRYDNSGGPGGDNKIVEQIDPAHPKANSLVAFGNTGTMHAALLKTRGPGVIVQASPIADGTQEHAWGVHLVQKKNRSNSPSKAQVLPSTLFQLPDGVLPEQALFVTNHPPDAQATFLANHPTARVVGAVQSIIQKVYIGKQCKQVICDRTQHDATDFQGTHLIIMTNAASAEEVKRLVNDTTLDAVDRIDFYRKGATHSGMKVVSYLEMDFHATDNSWLTVGRGRQRGGGGGGGRGAWAGSGSASGSSASSGFSYTNPNTPVNPGPNPLLTGANATAVALLTPSGTPSKTGHVAIFSTPLPSSSSPTSDALALAPATDITTLAKDLRAEMKTYMETAVRQSLKTALSPYMAKQKSGDEATARAFDTLREQREDDAVALQKLHSTMKTDMRTAQEKAAKEAAKAAGEILSLQRRMTEEAAKTEAAFQDKFEALKSTMATDQSSLMAFLSARLPAPAPAPALPADSSSPAAPLNPPPPPSTPASAALPLLPAALPSPSSSPAQPPLSLPPQNPPLLPPHLSLPRQSHKANSLRLRLPQTVVLTLVPSRVREGHSPPGARLPHSTPLLALHLPLLLLSSCPCPLPLPPRLRPMVKP